MLLNEYVAKKRRSILDTLLGGNVPIEGEFDQAAFLDAMSKGRPQMGSTRYSSSRIYLEFLFVSPDSSSIVLTVELASPQRIVFMPVPKWVVESIWEGEIDGTHQFEADAQAMLSEFATGLSVEGNAKWFGPQSPKRRQ